MDVYEDLSNDFVQKKSGIEAKYRLGDVLFSEKKFSEAVDSYRTSIKEHPRYQGIFPNAYYNIGESLFWQGKYKQALESYLKFIKLFPYKS